MTTLKTLISPAVPPKVIDGNPTCGNGHPWKTATTRWRFRDRGGKHGSGWERDCLVCKDMANKSRAKNTAGMNQQLIVSVNNSGTYWGTK